MPTAYERRVKDSNDLLLEAYGTSYTGLPNKKWCWSESERFPYPKRDEGGNLVFDQKCACGTNKPARHNADEALALWNSIPTGGALPDFGSDPHHRNDCPGIMQPIVVYKMARVVQGFINSDGKDVRNQYFLATWQPPPSRWSWEQMFGKNLPYDFYQAGFYVPTQSGTTVEMKDGGVKFVTIAVGAEHDPPDINFTRMLIAKSREFAERKLEIMERNRLEREKEESQILLPGTEENPSSMPFRGSYEKRRQMLEVLKHDGPNPRMPRYSFGPDLALRGPNKSTEPLIKVVRD